MQEVRIEVDVYCDWQSDPQAYRLWLDGELFTERTYIWDNPRSWVREILVAELDFGEHEIVIEPVDPNFKGFSLRNFAIDNVFQRLNGTKFTVSLRQPVNSLG